MASRAAEREAVPILRTLARRVRGLRTRRGWTRSELASRSGLSVRFLARVEAGDGNISILRLDHLARALETTAERLVRPLEAPGPSIALVGLRGAGKSTIGTLLAHRLGLAFVEVDDHITEASGLGLDQLFDLHGERYYRRLEHERLQHILAADRATVIAVAGGVVNEPASWDLLRRRTRVVWLRARPEDHWNRVVAQGDRRPMADNPAAMEDLRGLLRAREPLYAEAPIHVDTSGRAPEDVAGQLAERLAAAAPAAGPE